jgi:hypothetical protein
MVLIRIFIESIIDTCLPHPPLMPDVLPVHAHDGNTQHAAGAQRRQPAAGGRRMNDVPRTLFVVCCLLVVGGSATKML